MALDTRSVPAAMAGVTLGVSCLANIVIGEVEKPLLLSLPTPRGIISVAFSGPDRKTLYVTAGGRRRQRYSNLRTLPGHNVAKGTLSHIFLQPIREFHV